MGWSGVTLPDKAAYLDKTTPSLTGSKICRRGLHYFTGRTCAECKKAGAAAWYVANRKRSKELASRRYSKAAATQAKKEWRHKNPLHSTWVEMRRRCNSPKMRQYSDYGGRGIKVCARWSGVDGFANFAADMGPKPSKLHTLNRNDNDGHYEPDNCSWVTWQRQNRNRRSSLILEYRGKSQCAKDWAEELKIPYRTLVSRLYKLGWTVERALAK